MTELNQQTFETEREEFITKLFRTASHDLNNILSPIIGYPELMMDGFSPDSQEYEDLKEIKTLANRAIHVIKNVQMLLRPDLKSLRACDLNESIRTVFQDGSLSEDAQQKLDAVTIQLNLESELSPVGSSRSVLQSLLSCLFTPMLLAYSGSEAANVYTENGGDVVVLRVTYPVIELSEDDVARLKEPFFLKKRFSSSLTGLEVSVAEELVRQHQGSYTIEYKNGELHHTCKLPVFSES